MALSQPASSSSYANEAAGVFRGGAAAGAGLAAPA